MATQQVALRLLHDNEHEEVVEEAASAPWRSLFNFTARQHTGHLVFAIALSVASGVVIPGLAYLLGIIFDDFSDLGAGVITGEDLLSKVSTDVLYLVALGGASWLFNGAFFMAWIAFGEMQAKNARDRLYDNMLEKEISWYDRHRSGVSAMVQRLQTQIRELQLATSQPLGFVVQYLITIIAALGLAFYNSWDLSLVTLATVPIGAVVLAWISGRMQPAVDKQAAELLAAAKIAKNALTAIDTVKCYNAQDFEAWQYADIVKKAAVQYLSQARANALQIGFVRLMTLSLFVQGFWYGSYLVTNGKRTSGQVLTAFWGCLMATQTFEQILPQIIVLEKGRSAGATLATILARMSQGDRIAQTTATRISPRYCDGDVQFHDVRIEILD